MRILFFAPAFTRFRGGIEAMIAILTNHLCQRGHEVGILTEGDAEQHPDPIFPIPSSVPIFQVWIHDTQEVRERLREIVRGFAPDVFVVRGASFVYFYMIDAVRGTNTRLILSESYDPEASAKHFPSSMARLTAFAGADRIHFLVDSFKDSLPPHLRERVRPISNPVEPNPRLARPEGAQGQRKTIINVARITFFQKAQDALVTAFAKLASKYPEWDLVLVGDTFKTHDHDALVKLVEERRLQNRVRILGSLPKPEVYALLSESHIFAFPSLFEGFGIALVEGMASGLPCIGYREAPAVNQLIEHGVNGLLVPELGSPDTLARGLDELMASPELRRELGARGLEFSRRFHHELIAQKWEDLILEAGNIERSIMSGSPSEESVLLGALHFRLAQERLLFDRSEPKRGAIANTMQESREFRVGKKILGYFDRLLPIETRRRRILGGSYRWVRRLRS